MIYSDNGINFVGAENHLKTLDWVLIAREFSVRMILWKHIPPSAAWWGEWWERLVQMVKKLLKKVIGTASLKYEELVAILCDAEALINSKPLTYLSEDPRDLLPLTPAMSSNIYRPWGCLTWITSIRSASLGDSGINKT